MGLFYERLVRPMLFQQDPERAHQTAVFFLRHLSSIGWLCRLLQRLNRVDSEPSVELFGLSFPNRVGLAAGMDKNGKFWRAAPALGFGHAEIGTVTYSGQPGNPLPRLFRYAGEEAIINRMGFNNDGAEAIGRRLQRARADLHRPLPLGINIGKSKITPLERAAEDYLGSFELLADYADYFAVNVSSPNTPELRRLQDRDHLHCLLSALRGANQDRAQRLGRRPLPLLVKIAPDLSFPEIDAILETVLDLGCDGIIATNSTVSRPPAFGHVVEEGGLTGQPLHERSVEVIRYIHGATGGGLPIVGVGGIIDGETAAKTLEAGASLLQIYTGLVFRGPFLATEILRALPSLSSESA